MLQQTQVNTVIPYYKKFMRNFPSIKALALADNNDVLDQWSGLGYYARARNLHKTAKIIHEQFSGRMPNTVEGLLALPGIGRSTAGAILSLSMQQSVSILDGNVKRVLTRYLAVPGWPGKGDVHQQLWNITDALTPQERCNDYNQALMDLGATICTRSKPKCTQCPFEKNCLAHKVNRETEFPHRKTDKKTKPYKKSCFIILQNKQGDILLEQRPPLGIWGSLWCFPEHDEPIEKLEQYCKSEFNTSTKNAKRLEPFVHKFSHYDLEISPIILSANKQPHLLMESQPRVWYKPGDKLPGGIAAPIKTILMTLLRKKPNDTPNIL